MTDICPALSHVSQLPCELSNGHTGQHRHGKTTWGTDVRPRSGRHANRRRQVTADADDWALMDRAVEHALEPSWSEWALHVLLIAACDELGLDPLDRTPVAQTTTATSRSPGRNGGAVARR